MNGRNSVGISHARYLDVNYIISQYVIIAYAGNIILKNEEELSCYGWNIWLSVSLDCDYYFLFGIDYVIQSSPSVRTDESTWSAAARDIPKTWVACRSSVQSSNFIPFTVILHYILNVNIYCKTKAYNIIM